MLLQHVNRPVWVARGVLNPAAGSGEQSPPGSGATIVIYDSTANNNGLQFSTNVPFSRLVLSINSSANSAASGVIIEGSEDNGANWDAMQAAQSYVSASGLTQYDILVTSPQVRIRYTNSAAVLTTWRMSLEGIIGDRSKGS
jgi:hypothetical protein